MSPSDTLREHLLKLLDGRDAHVDFRAATDDIPPALRGAVPAGLPHSAWQILEHLRIAQHDILDFCVNPAYKDMRWPDDYWPTTPAPPTASAWDESLAAYRRADEAIRQIVRDPLTDLFATIPHGTGQTYLREIFLVADHAAYHIGQLVLVRRLLGIWPGGR